MVRCRGLFFHVITHTVTQPHSVGLPWMRDRARRRDLYLTTHYYYYYYYYYIIYSGTEVSCHLVPNRSTSRFSCATVKIEICNTVTLSVVCACNLASFVRVRTQCSRTGCWVEQWKLFELHDLCWPHFIRVIGRACGPHRRRKEYVQDFGGEVWKKETAWNA
jgi:hypothetical protein